jgi:hypothetical protein
MAPGTRATRYERIMLEHAARGSKLAGRLASASAQARRATPVTSARQEAIRDAAAGVAGPALACCVIWMLNEARDRRVTRLRFLSRDGQVLYEIAQRLGSVPDTELDLEYVYSSRLTWNLAATDPVRLASAPWLFNSFMRSNAVDLCTRLGLPVSQYQSLLATCGVSLDPAARAGEAAQDAAMRRFLSLPQVRDAVAQRIGPARELVVAYAAQHALADERTALVDTGWTGRMIGSLVTVCEAAGMSRPHVLLWGHEPRASGWSDRVRVAAWMYDTAAGHGHQWRVPDAPFLVETFCMGDHGITISYARQPSGQIAPVLDSMVNSYARDWGLDLYRATVYAFCTALSVGGALPAGDARPVVHAVMDAFWCHPTRTEARAWGAYPYDSDPAGTATRRLARPFTIDNGQAKRGDRAWIAGSLALSTPGARAAYLRTAQAAELAGDPASD